MVEYRALLDTCYRQVFFADGATAPIKTFDDCLSDFYLYLLEAKPKRVSPDIEGYYLQQVKDEKALSSSAQPSSTSRASTNGQMMS